MESAHIDDDVSASLNSIVETVAMNSLSLGELHVIDSNGDPDKPVGCSTDIIKSEGVLPKDGDHSAVPACETGQETNNCIDRDVDNQTEKISEKTAMPSSIDVQDDTTEKKEKCLDTRVQEALKTIATYKTLVKNKGAHQMILKEEVLIGQLVLFLGDDSPQVVNAAFEVVKILYNNRNNHVALKNSLHFLEALIVVSRTESLSTKVREDARKMYDIVKSAKVPLSQLNDANNTNSSVEDRPETHSKQATSRSSFANSKTNRSRNSDRETVISLNPTVLLQPVKRQRITAAVVKIKGIISVTYNLNRHYCVIRAKSHVPPEVFGKTIANLGLECFLVRRNELKEEILIKIEADDTLENSVSALEQENMPAYLPDDDEDESESRNDMVARGDENPEGVSVAGKIHNFFRRSFFW